MSLAGADALADALSLFLEVRDNGGGRNHESSLAEARAALLKAVEDHGWGLVEDSRGLHGQVKAINRWTFVWIHAQPGREDEMDVATRWFMTREEANEERPAGSYVARLAVSLGASPST